MEPGMTALLILGGSIVVLAAACMVLALLTDHEAAGATGVMKPGQRW